jgi:hypothetical protein
MLKCSGIIRYVRVLNFGVPELEPVVLHHCIPLKLLFL